MTELNASAHRRSFLTSFLVGGGVGALGGLIGLGGAEFRLPLLIGIFGFEALPAVILNKAMSLVVVGASLPSRLFAVPFADMLSHSWVVVNLLCGSVIGAWTGASWATRLKSRQLYQVISVLLLVMAAALLFSHFSHGSGQAALQGTSLLVAGVVAGFLIGVVAALLGVAGGELLIPTLVLLYGVDLKLAGSLSLAISLPTMLTSFARYSRDRSFEVVRQQSGFAGTMALGSIIGAFAGGQLLRFANTSILLPILAAILVVSAVKMWRHS